MPMSERLPTSTWVDVCIATQVDAGELLGMLSAPSEAGAWDEAGRVHLYWPIAAWTAEARASVATALRALGDAAAVDTMTVVPVPDQDWNAEWAKTVKPIRIGARVVVRPPWETVEAKPGMIELIIEPKLAFGTGHHATTQLLVEWVEQVVRGGERVLDVGTGTGILAMVALRLGARFALGIDCDGQAVSFAQGYATDNRFGEELQLREGLLDAATVEAPDGWDLVLANLDRRAMTETAAPLGALVRRGASLFVSGLLADQVEEMRAVFAQEGAYVVERRDRDGWVALRLGAGQGCEGDGAA